jgi:hypothetical protein
MLLYPSCVSDKKKQENDPGITAGISPESVIEYIHGTTKDTLDDNGTKETNPNAVSTRPTNDKEIKLDEVKKEEIINDLANSKYQDCSEIILDYELAISEFRKGNHSPIRDFPIDKDPMILLCKSKNPKFTVAMDSLRTISKKIIQEFISSR